MRQWQSAWPWRTPGWRKETWRPGLQLHGAPSGGRPAGQRNPLARNGCCISTPVVCGTAIREGFGLKHTVVQGARAKHLPASAVCILSTAFAVPARLRLCWSEYVGRAIMATRTPAHAHPHPSPPPEPHKHTHPQTSPHPPANPPPAFAAHARNVHGCGCPGCGCPLSCRARASPLGIPLLPPGNPRGPHLD